MNFKKLVLATAIATVSSASFAMEAMDEEALSDTTGQDGLTININPPDAGIGADIWIHDKDGLSGISGASSNSGAIVVDGFLLNPSGANSFINVVIDVTGDANNAAPATDPMLNVAITLPASTVISTGKILVADSNGAGVAVGTNQKTILDNMNITLVGATLINMQLGNEQQGSMILVSTTITGGVTITNFALQDSGGTVTGGSINADSISFKNNGGANLTAKVGVDASATALRLTLTTLGDPTTGLNISMANVGLGADGTATVGVGDIDIVGLNLNGTTVDISGH